MSLCHVAVHPFQSCSENCVQSDFLISWTPGFLNTSDRSTCYGVENQVKTNDQLWSLLIHVEASVEGTLQELCFEINLAHGFQQQGPGKKTTRCDSGPLDA